MSRILHLQTLGPGRNLLLDCLGANTPRAPGFLAMPPGADALAAYGEYVTDLSRNDTFLGDPMAVLLLAAARLLTGDIKEAAFVLAHFPAAQPQQRFGQRYCPLLPYRTLLAALPLPRELTDLDRWTDGSPDQAALQAWLSRHCSELEWLPKEARYVLPA